MTTRAYAETYLNDAQNNLGDMMDYAVHTCKYQADDFFAFFLLSGVSEEFERGNPKFVAGMSGAELAAEVNFRICGRYLAAAPPAILEDSAERWLGRAVAYCQWHSCCHFREIAAVLPFSEALKLYPKLREDGIESFAEEISRRLMRRAAVGASALARIRKGCGMSQKRLAATSGVALRMIQLYEQKQNDINRAQAAALRQLARALHCEMEDLLEPEVTPEKQERLIPEIAPVWRRICSCAGQTFRTPRGMTYSYQIFQQQICMNNTNCAIPRSDVAKALTVPNPTVLRFQKMKLQGPSYLLGILSDSRIRH